jgi:hypothetical protein
MKEGDLNYIPPYLDNPSATYMLSDPMWVLEENIVIDNIAKRVAEEPIEDWILNPRYEYLRFPAKFYRLELK